MHTLGSFFGPPTLVDLLRHRTLHQPADIAYTFLVDGESEEVSLTFADWDRQARRVAACLQARRLAGQRALLLYPPGPEFLAGFFGCLYAGVVAVPAYPPRMNRSLERILAVATDSEAAVALTTDSVLDRVRPALEATPALKRLAWLATDRLETGIEDDWQDPDSNRETLAFLQYTSGSTGTPKGVMLRHANLLHNCALIAHSFEMTRSCRGIFWLPCHHDMGLVGGILAPLYLGCPNISMSPMAFLQRPFRWLQAISRYRGTTSGGPNFAYDLCVRKTTPEQRARLDLSCWNVAFNGAEPVRAETIRRFSEVFEPCGFRREAFYPCYGMAEATLIVSGGDQTQPPVVRAFDAKALENRLVVEVPDHDEGARALVSSGHTLADERIVIADPETMTHCDPGQVGEIWVSNPSVAQGYWKRIEETAHTFGAMLSDTGEGPFLRTGDLGFFQEHELFVAGRLKDLIIIRGLNHYPHDIELTVEKSHPALRPGCGAAFTTETDDATRLVIVYEVDRRHLAETDAVFDCIRRDVAREHELLVDSILLVRSGSIPKTSSGKIQRHACRDAFVQGRLEAVDRWDGLAVDEPAQPAADEKAAKSDHPVAPLEPQIRYSAEMPKHSAPPAKAVSDEQPAPGPEVLEPSAAFANGAPSIPGQITAELVLEEVQKIAKERAKKITLDTSIVELGLDSLERVEILAALEQRFGGRIPEDLYPQLETCRELMEAAEKYLGGGEAAGGQISATDVPEEFYRFDRFQEYLQLKDRLDQAERSGLGNPFFNVHERVTADTTIIAGRELINFSSYNYLGMSGDAAVSKAAKEAIDRYGTSVSASRVVSGEKAIHRDLERAIADFLGAADSVVFVGGHSTNESTIGHLMRPGDLILHDALAHNSIVQGCILSGARRRPFPHNDWQTVDQLLRDVRGDYRRVLIAIEGTYSMDGDIPDLPRFIEVKKRHKTLLIVDEAHSAGVLGPHGRGIGEYWDVNPDDVDLWMGTLSKSFGSCGGYIAGSKPLVEYLKYTAPGFVYSVGISPANTAAALASIRLLEIEPQRVARLHERASLFLSLAREHGLNTGLSKDTPVVPIILGDSLKCMHLSQALNRRGVNVQPIVYPAVEERAARLRFFVTCKHTEEQIRHTIDVLADELARIDPAHAMANGAPAATVHATPG